MFTIIFNESALEDLRFLAKTEQTNILAAVERQLADEPLKATRNRKPLRPNDLSRWALRAGVIRVFYDVDEQVQEVTIKAVGRKEHNKLFIRGQEYQL